MTESKRQICTVIAAVVLLLSCACSHSPAPISSRQAPPSILITKHLVSKGETLFSIAWRYEKNLQKLAAANNIVPPYTIHPGQRLTLDTSRASSSLPIVVKKPASSKPAAKVNSKKPPVLKSTSIPVRKSTSVTKSTKKVLPKSWQWTWPVKGRVVKKFGADSFFKGIDIVSLPGAPVYPAAPGVVVYSGSGLRGYGKLIIIKHSDVYLSAYAHNRKVFINEGDSAVTSKKIAEVGGDPANSRRFYFEIRKDGKPVNPLNYLPR